MGTNGKLTHIWVDLLFSSFSFMSLRPNHWCRNCLCHNNGCLWIYLHYAFIIFQIIHVLVAYMHFGNAWTSIDYLCNFSLCIYMRFVLGLDGRLKFEPKFIMAWKFSAHLKLKQNGVHNIVGVEVGTWICLKAISNMKFFFVIRSVLLSKPQVMLGVPWLNFLPMMIKSTSKFEVKICDVDVHKLFYN